MQYWLHYSWTLVLPRCRSLTIVLVLLRGTLATSIHLLFAGEKTIGEFFGAIGRECYIGLINQSVYLIAADFDVDLIYILL